MEWVPDEVYPTIPYAHLPKVTYSRGASSIILLWKVLNAPRTCTPRFALAVRGTLHAPSMVRQ